MLIGVPLEAAAGQTRAAVARDSVGTPKAQGDADGVPLCGRVPMPATCAGASAFHTSRS